MIKKLLTILLLLILLCSYHKQEEPKWIDVVFSRTKYLPYETIMTIPTKHKPYHTRRINMSVKWFVFEDSSYIYWTQMGDSPNKERMCPVMDSALFEKRFNQYSFCDFNPRGDTLWPVSCSGVDFQGNCWKDIHYIFPDSLLCYRKRKGKLVVDCKSTIYRITIGYARVPQWKKDIFDKALASFRIRKSDRPIPKEEQYYSEKCEVSCFKYEGDTTGIFVEAPEMSLLWERCEQ